MTTKEESRPLVAQETGQSENAACSRAAFSNVDFITDSTERQALRVADVLPRERENAMKMSELKQLFSEDSRTIRLMIQRERQCIPIVSDCQHGYWIGSVEDVRMFARSMRGRARQIWRTAANVEKAAGLTRSVPQVEGQTNILDGGGT